MRVLRSSLFALMLSSASIVGLAASAQAQISAAINVTVAPPPLPEYDQPPLPEIGYLWSPGYWAWDGSDYYWVPGSWVLPPQPDLLWTPGWWGFNNGFYAFNAGYWGGSVGYYGDVDYGYGYYGLGYQGGYWNHGNFYYNRRVNNVTNVHDGHFYDRDVPNNPGASRVSYHGGQGGTERGPNRWETAASHGMHDGPTALQTQHREAAAKAPDQRFAKNHGRPPVAATAKPGAFAGPGVVAAHPEKEAPKPAPAEAAKTGAEAPKAHEDKTSVAPKYDAAKPPEPARGAGADRRAPPARQPVGGEKAPVSPKTPATVHAPTVHPAAAAPGRRHEQHVAPPAKAAPHAQRPAPQRREPAVQRQQRPAPRMQRQAPERQQPQMQRQQPQRQQPQMQRPQPQRQPQPHGGGGGGQHGGGAERRIP